MCLRQIVSRYRVIYKIFCCFFFVVGHKFHLKAVMILYAKVFRVFDRVYVTCKFLCVCVVFCNNNDSVLSYLIFIIFFCCNNNNFEIVT